MASGIGVLTLAIAATYFTGVFGFSSTTEYFLKTYAFLGSDSSCGETVYLDSGSRFRVNAWSSSSKSGSGSTCTLYFTTAHYNPSLPKFNFKFDSNTRNYIDEDSCSVSLKIYDESSSFYTPRYTYNCFSPSYSFSTYETTIYSEYFTVEFDRNFFDSSKDFDFSLIVTVDYDTYATIDPPSARYYVSWYTIVWPIVAVIVIISIVAGACRSYRYRRLARSQATNRNAAIISTANYPTGSQPYTSAPPPNYPAGPQPYPAGPQPYPAGPQPYPAGSQPYTTEPQGNPTQAYPTQPQAYPTQPQAYPMQPYPSASAPPPTGEADPLPPKYEDVASAYPPPS